MRHLGIKAKAAEHATESLIDKKTINKNSIALKNNFQRLINAFGDFGSKCKAVARAHGNDADVYINSPNGICKPVYGSISTANNNVSDLF